MWQRFTERARKVVYSAQAAARLRSGGFVEPEHLLLGLLQEPDRVAGRVLEEFGVAAEALRAAILSL